MDCIEANTRLGVPWIQVREKDLEPRDLLALVREAVRRSRPFGTKVLVNARLDVALAADADGLHLPGNGPPASALRSSCPDGFLIGSSTHDLEELRRAEREGVDFAVYGPVFPTRSKPGLTEVVGLKGLQAACMSVRLPVFALGGVDAGRERACVDAGAAGVAGIGMFQRDCPAVR